MGSLRPPGASHRHTYSSTSFLGDKIPAQRGLVFRGKVRRTINNEALARVVALATALDIGHCANLLWPRFAQDVHSHAQSLLSFLTPSFLASFDETAQGPLHLFPGFLSTQTLAFNHASGNKGGPCAGRVLEESPDKGFSLNGVLVQA